MIFHKGQEVISDLGDRMRVVDPNPTPSGYVEVEWLTVNEPVEEVGQGWIDSFIGTKGLWPALALEPA